MTGLDRLPEAGRYRCILADPPWDHGITERLGGRGRRPGAHASYPRMPLDQLCALPVADLAAPTAHLWLWITTGRLLTGDHLQVCTAWGFTPVSMVTWAKTGRSGLGTYLRSSTEHLILARRGWNTVPDKAWPTTWIQAPRGRHSVKPPVFADMIEQVSPAPRVELFARAQRLGWDSWGAGYDLEQAV